ncbi:MAG: ABC transporter substrate-binding protein [Lachnospiraceae bacterium]|nr:ABC transporter substrate-binding protein [Lachnospiraceae bacterium]
MKKKLWTLILTAVLGMSAVLGGCGQKETETVTIRIGSLKGPTSMGLVSLMDQTKNGEAGQNYEFTMAAAADEINAAFLKGDLDIVLIPANVASVLYHKTEGQIAVVDINTLGVLYLLESKETVSSVADLAGRTVYLPGKGTTPDYALQYLLEQNGIEIGEVDLQYKSEAAEVISALSEEPDALGLLPQPAATTACMQQKDLRIALDLTEEWDKVTMDSSLVTGVTAVRREFLEQNEAAVQAFVQDHMESAQFANENVEEAAELVAALEIVPKATVAAQAIPYCNITCLTGKDLRTALSGYLDVLAGQNPEAVGGKVPSDDFYYEFDPEA